MLERFETVRPDAASKCVSTPTRARTVGRAQICWWRSTTACRRGGNAAKLERYDHFVSGWAPHLPVATDGACGAPAVVFVCRDNARAREYARAADQVLTACQAYAGEYPVRVAVPRA